MSDFPDKDAMPGPEQMFENMKEADGKGLDVSKRSPGSMPEPAPASIFTDAELDQYTSLYDFDGATMFDADWMGQVAEDFDQFNAIGSNPDLNASPVTMNEQYPIVTSSTSANEPSSEQNPTDTPPADIPSLDNRVLSQERQDDFLNTLDENSPEEINSWYANAVATRANSNGLSEQNGEENIPEFTQQDQAILDSFGPAIAEEISAKYPAQDELNMASSQTSQAPTAQITVLQSSEQLGGTSNTNSLEDPTSSHVQPKDNVTTLNQMDELIESTEKESPASILNFHQYDETFLSAQTIPSSPMNHDEHATSNDQGSTSQSSIRIQKSAPVMTVQQPFFRQNEAAAAQEIFEHNSLGGRGEYDEYRRVTQMQSEDDSTYAPAPHRYPDPSHGDFGAAQAPQPYPCLQAFGNNNLGAGIEMQRAGNDRAGIENRVDNTNNVVSQRKENDQRSKASQVSKKRAGWETRPDAARPRVRMTEEEFQWLRPNEGPRDVFETQRKKAAEEKLKKEAEADAMEKAGMPRPQSKQQKPFRGGIHIEVWEKERLNNRRRAQGKSGRDLFLEKPKLRGKRKGREMSEVEPQPESKKLKLEESGRFESHSESKGVNEGWAQAAYASSMPAVDRFNRGMSSYPYSDPNPMTGQMNQGMTSSGPIHNSYIDDHYGDYYGNNYGNNNYAGNHYTGPSLGNGVMSSGMTRNGALGSMPASGAAYLSMSQGSRPESHGAHQTQAVYSHNQHPGSFHGRPEQKVTANYGRNSGPQAVMNPANEPSANGGNGIPSYIAGQNAQVLRSIDHVYYPNQLGGMRSIPNNWIDPMLQSQAHFPVPSVMGAQTREHALENHEYDEEFEDFGAQEKRSH
ncbi:hypothetical protein BCON_0413g00010 [Botryotinia convoluta]|uniref:Uncharacterized protein n=1 Tax=Botryotinia convoluta TaxID=54673 RepID=A0A4Z1H7R9_9HELO|nr:hypothetical protein BCON_0413g00010 [Botryotinia convoluta]